MSSIADVPETSAVLAQELTAYVSRCVARNSGDTIAVKPGHRIKFHWPPHPVSYRYHVHASDWKGRATLEAYGETFDVEVARTSNGVFGRIQELWHEDRGQTEPAMLAALRESLEPLFAHRFAISQTLEREERFTGHIRDLQPLDLLKLLYCPDRDIASDSRKEIELRASSMLFLPALLTVLRDESHPHRRSAQWCVLDLFEDLPSYASNEAEAAETIETIRELIVRAEDDYARTVYKAGVVLGGHLEYPTAGPALMSCLDDAGRIGRRAAIHGLFHYAEWKPDAASEVIDRLTRVGETDPEPLLREYAAMMARDVAAGYPDHVVDVLFPDEP